MTKPRRTKKQQELMGHVLKAASEGRYLTPTELHRLVSYECSYGAIRVSIRFLEGQGVLERSPEGRETNLVPTELAYAWYRPGV